MKGWVEVWGQLCTLEECSRQREQAMQRQNKSVPGALEEEQGGLRGWSRRCWGRPGEDKGRQMTGQIMGGLKQPGTQNETVS